MASDISGVDTLIDIKLFGAVWLESPRSVSTGNLIDTPNVSRSRRQTSGGPDKPDETMAQIWAGLPRPKDATNLMIPSLESG